TRSSKARSSLLSVWIVSYSLPGIEHQRVCETQACTFWQCFFADQINRDLQFPFQQGERLKILFAGQTADHKINIGVCSEQSRSQERADDSHTGNRRKLLGKLLDDLLQ